MLKLVLLFIFVAAITGGPYWLLCWYEKRQKTIWKLKAEGIFDHAVSKTSTMRFRHPFWLTMVTITTIFFQDGKTWPIYGVIQNLPAPGTRIKVYKNGFGEARIEQAA